MAVAASVDGEAETVVVGLAKCADCTRKNMKAEDAFKGLQVAIKCKNDDGEYESKAVGELDRTGTFSVPIASADLLGADCFAQLHSATSTPCPGQEPSKIVPLSTDKDGGKANTFVAVAGKMHHSSAECTSAFLCDHFHKNHFFDYFHKKPVPPKPDPKPSPENGGGAVPENGGGVVPSPSASPVYH
ncbi:hypothetical protein ABZP36_011597 [Zizania latifolia]